MTEHRSSASRHQVSRAVDAVSAQLSEVMDSALWSLSAEETAGTLTALTRLIAKASALEARVAHHASVVQVEDLNGATSTATWWAAATRQTRVEAFRKVHLAAGLEKYGLVQSALARGDLVVDQAQVIVRSLDALPDDLDPGVVGQAMQRLLDLAEHHDAKSLQILGRRILEVVDPERADAEEEKQLRRDETKAAATMRLTMSDDGHGRVHGRFTLPAAQGAMLKKILLGFAAPKHVAATHGAVGERVPNPLKMGRAFAEMIERYPTDKVPATGGVNATVVVTMSLETLLGAERAATLDTGERITAGQARRLACEAGIIPAVLGGQSQVLDLGRKRRFYSESQRIALGVEQQGCTADGCDWPPGLCHAHHDTRWADGGPTDKRHGRLLCPKHHARAHDPAYTTAKLPGGKVAFTRRP
ncbi:MAG: DUF222 domain-containing protein, partial [Nocardioides sp.]